MAEVLIAEESLQSGSNNNYDADIQHVQCQRLFQGAPSANFAVLVGVILLFPTYYFEPAGFDRYLLWLVIMVVFTLLRVSAYLAYSRRPELLSPSNWQRTYLLFTGLLGFAWSSSIWLMIPAASPYAALFLQIILIGMMAASVPLLSSNVYAVSIYTFPVAASLSLYYIMQASLIGFSQALVFLILFLLVAMSSKRLFKLQLESIRNDFQLSRTIDLLHSHNDNLAQEVNSQTQKLQEQKLIAEEASSAKSNFLSTLSHEIRTPLNGVIGMLEILNTRKLSEQDKHLANVSWQSARQLLELLNDVLDLSKIESNMIDIQLKPVSLIGLILEARQTFLPLAHKKGLELQIDLPAQEIMVEADVAHINQVLRNLVSNAIKFTTEGHIEIKLEQVPGPDDLVKCCFSVSDTGAGLEPEEQVRIFEPFYQVTAPDLTGTGLGLPISRALVSQLGGELTVDSQPAKGSTFRFELLLQACVEYSVTGMESDETTLNLHVLVVEDNMVNREVAVGLLNAMGCSTECAENGEDAVNLLKDGSSYDVILMDLQMPKMDGFEATLAIRQLEAEQARPATPIVAVTANALVETQKECMQAGMNGFVTKPVYRDRLREAVLEVTSGP